MKLWIQTLMIWGGVLCFAWGSYKSNADQLLHMRGKAFVHTVELLQQVKAKTAGPLSANAPIKTVSLRLPDLAALPLSSYNLRCPVSAAVETRHCCAIVFKEPEKAKISSEMFLTCRTEGMAGTGSGTPMTVKYPRQELFPDLPNGITLAFRRTEMDARLPTPVFLSPYHETFISSVDIVRASGFEVRRNMGGASLLACPDLKEITIAARPPVVPVDNTRPSISLARADSRFGSALENNIHIAPLRVDAESVLRAWAGNTLASIPSVPAIKFNAVAFQDKEWSMNPVLVSYHSENMSGSLRLLYNTLYNIHGPASATGSITSCCAIVFKEPEKTIISSEVFLTCRVEGMPEAGSGTPLTLKGLQKELFVSQPSVVTLAFWKTEIDSFLSAQTFSLTSSRGSPINLANTVPASYFEVRRNLTETQLPDMRELAILTTVILPTDDVRLPINLVRAEDHFDGISADRLQIAPLSISAESVLQATENAPTSIPPVLAIELNRAAFRDVTPSANPILVSYHHEDIADSISSINNTLSGFNMRRTSPDIFSPVFPELNEVVIALKPVAPENSVQSPIRLICADNLSGGVSESDLQKDPVRFDAESVLHAWASSALICVPPALELNAAEFRNVAQAMNPILVSCRFADVFVGAAPVRLNSLKTDEDISVQIRRLIFMPAAAQTAIQQPCALVLHQVDLPPQTIERMLISGLIDEVRSGRINKRNPEIRAQLVKFLGDNPFGPTSQQVFSMILENFTGNALRRKIAALQAWAQEYAGGRYAPVLGYHIMHQFYRNKDYDAAIQFAESFLKKTKEFNDRVRFLQALCYAQKNNTTAALDVLQKIQHDYPESPMAPESKFLHAWIFYEDGNMAEAQTILKELVAKYPNSDSAVKAGNLLEAINQKNSLAALKP